MQQNLQKKSGLVKKVFDNVYNKYDLMNDFMSLGIHRQWKRELIRQMNPYPESSLIDVACGTGDIAKLYSNATNNECEILCIDPNKKMISVGRNKLANYNNIKWKSGYAEKLPVQNDYYDFYTISFGLRNTKNIKSSIKEAYRVLKRGGRFFCLEFSKIDNQNLDFVYKKYSKMIPKIGKYIVGDEKPYEYLVKSIEKFPNQNQILGVMKECKFVKCKYRNLSGGIVSIHTGWKI